MLQISLNIHFVKKQTLKLMLKTINQREEEGGGAEVSSDYGLGTTQLEKIYSN